MLRALHIIMNSFQQPFGVGIVNHLRVTDSSKVMTRKGYSQELLSLESEFLPSLLECLSFQVLHPLMPVALSKGAVF